MVKRGCILQDAKVNGKKSDGEGCEEILREPEETYFEQILCLCKTDLCNGAIKVFSEKLLLKTILYLILFQSIAHQYNLGRI